MYSYGGGDAREGLEPAGEIIGQQEAVDVRFQLFVREVVIPVHHGVLDGSVHAFNLSICRGMRWLGESIADSVLIAAAIEHPRDPLSRRPVTCRGGCQTWLPLSVRIVWVLCGTASIIS